jgi:hypothetical protein
MLYNPVVFSPRASLTGRRKIGIFFGRRPNDLKLYRDKTMLMRLTVDRHEGEMRQSGFSLRGTALSGGMEALPI